ncbi:putative transcription factor interactor and regulator CCHC(Zn) family [Helianthus annuus]|nr:putative transcription factor interactor and regulator CCHC(Zn) family [Helianthus annuus]
MSNSMSSSLTGFSSALSAVTAPNCGIPPLTGDNFAAWKDALMLTLGLLDFDYALREKKPADLTTQSTAAEQLTHEKWTRCNRMSLMFMKQSISNAIRGAIPDSEDAKTYLEHVEAQFKGTSKAHASTLILKLVTTKYDGRNGIREHIMMMNDMANKLKGLEMEISDGFLVHFIITSLPSSFEAFKINYNTQKEKWTMSELVAMCVQEEERMRMDRTTDVANFTTSNSKKRKNNYHRKDASKVQRPNPSSNTSAPSSSKNSLGSIRCKFCKKTGHMQKECPDFKEWLAKKGIPFNPEAGKKPKNA